ncbi:metal ABC transporter solute-binding protein, Zn/Mn family [Rothia sp. CCM 9416]|uniref:metal ABC transporter solute-binding protein, Zn/Mn family n=1 Tax=Rothia sp. CCM 9416 TaxID=3402655 RepID=UPI003AEAECAE
MKKILPATSLLMLSVLGLSACGQQSSNSAAPDQGAIKVVATTDVYADLVKEIGGERVEATPLIASTAVDPHSYEATSQDRLAVKDADIVVVNGGGYDAFLTDLAGNDNPGQKIVNAVEVSGLFSADDLAHMQEEHHGEADTDHDHEGHDHEGHDHEGHDHHAYNEHVWYDLDTMKKVADQVAADLAELDPDQADTYRSAARDFSTRLDELITRLKAVDSKKRTYLATEPVSGYLLQDAGFTDATPADLTAAVDSESDIAPLTLQEAKDLLGAGKIDLLAFNEQTQTAQTAEIFSYAQNKDVPSVSFTETLPENTGYIEWMNQNIDNLEKAVA